MKNATNKILLMAAPVNEEERSLAGRKQQKFDERLRIGTNRDEFELIPKLHLTVNDLQQALLQLKSDRRFQNIVHFIAQGTEDGNIVLADAAGRPDVVPGRAVLELFDIFKHDIRAIIFDGSNTEQLGRQLAGSVEYIISIDGRIGGDSSVVFFNNFYQGLSYGKDFGTAFKLGQNQLWINKDANYSKPVLYARNVVVPAKPSLEMKSGKFLAKTKRICGASSV